jgi:plastocyanin
MRMLVIAACLITVALAGCSGGAPKNEDEPGATIQPHTENATASASSAHTASSSAAAPDYTVELYDNRYDPTNLVVPNYQKVVFKNLGTLSHTVTIVRQGDPAGTTYRDQAIQTGSEIDFNFPNDGTYTVYCRYHGTETSGMHMTITV